MEKQVLRDAFKYTGILPPLVLYRSKEAFSDGVSAKEKSWFEIIQDKIHEQNLVPVGWKEDAYAKNMWPAPPTEEAYYYRSIFDKLYPHTGRLWPYWMPLWSPETTDPSARTLAAEPAP
jgi:asparagine synthase (glutamine-hydrolysing)